MPARASLISSACWTCWPAMLAVDPDGWKLLTGCRCTARIVDGSGVVPRVKSTVLPSDLSCLTIDSAWLGL